MHQMNDRKASDYGRVTPTINSSKLLKEMRRKMESDSVDRSRLRNSF